MIKSTFLRKIIALSFIFGAPAIALAALTGSWSWLPVFVVTVVGISIFLFVSACLIIWASEDTKWK